MPLPRQPSDVTDSVFSDDVIFLALPLNGTHLFLLPASVAFRQVGNLQLRKTTRPPETGPFCLLGRSGGVHASCRPFFPRESSLCA